MPAKYIPGSDFQWLDDQRRSEFAHYEDIYQGIRERKRARLRETADLPASEKARNDDDE